MNEPAEKLRDPRNAGPRDPDPTITASPVSPTMNPQPANSTVVVRKAGNTGLYIAVAVIALFVIGYFAFSPGADDGPVSTGDGAITTEPAAPATTAAPAPAAPAPAAPAAQDNAAPAQNAAPAPAAPAPAENVAPAAPAGEPAPAAPANQ